MLAHLDLLLHGHFSECHPPTDEVFSEGGPGGGHGNSCSFSGRRTIVVIMLIAPVSVSEFVVYVVAAFSSAVVPLFLCVARKNYLSLFFIKISYLYGFNSDLSFDRIFDEKY